MCDVPVFYASTEGQTQRIAMRTAARLRERGVDSQAIAIGSSQAAAVDWSRVRGVWLGASLHMQRHQKEAAAFVRRNRLALAAVPSMFVSVSLAAGSRHAASVQAARRIAEAFAAETGWQPSRIACVAGRLAYTQYNWFLRRVMRRIALKEGGSPDLSRDHEYTDWAVVERLADDLATDVLCRRPPASGQEPQRAAS